MQISNITQLSVNYLLEWEFIDASIVKAHQHSAGATGTEDQGFVHYYWRRNPRL